MDTQPLASGGAELSGPLRRELWLLGQPALRTYLDFVRDMVVDGGNADPKALCDEWREANDYYYELEQSEAGLADGAECRDLDPALAPLAEQVASDPSFCRTFDSLPTSFALVELDRLVVCQAHVTHDFVESLAARLGPAPDREALFRFCLPLGDRGTPLQVSRAGSRRYVFASESMDLRFHAPVLLAPGQVSGHASFGPVGGVVGLAVGFGSNLLNVVRADGRLLLHDGYHRACALRALGVTHAPCVIQDVTRRDELAIAAPGKVVEAAAFYFRAARPPLLKDFFDPRIRKLLPVRRVRRVVEVSFEVREYDVAD